MVASVNFNPYATTVAAGSFNVSSAGFIQGTALNDPSVRNQLAGGVLAQSETLPMWGGVGVAEGIPGAAGTPNNNLGPILTRATNLIQTSVGGMSGFTVFDQNSSMITSPQSPVPLAASGMGLTFYRFGSLARIAVACDPSLASYLGSPVGTQFSWDFVNQRLVPYSPAYAAITITGAVWANTNGGQVTFTVSTDPTPYLNANDDFNVANVVSTGGTGLGYNGAFTVVSATSTTIVASFPAASSPGTYSSGGSVLAGGGALPVKVLDFNIGNSMTVQYDPVTGFATWNRAGSTAIILI